MSVLAELQEGALVLTINRPEAGNSLNPAVGQGFVDATRWRWCAGMRKPSSATA